MTEIPDAVAGPGEVLIAVEAASIDPVDRGAVDPGYGDTDAGHGAVDPRLGSRRHASPPSAPASTPSLVGDRVLGFSQWFKGGPGLQRSLVALPRDNVAVVGDAIPSPELTTFGLNGLTALQVLDAAELEPGPVDPASSARAAAVGGFVAQIAEHRGLTVLTAGRDTPPADFAGMELDGLINTAPADPTRYLVAVRDDGVATSVTTPAVAERGIRSSRVGVKVDRERTSRPSRASPRRAC